LPCYAVEYSKNDHDADPVGGKRAHLAIPLSSFSNCIGDPLTVVIAHDEAGFLFFDGPRRREALTV
jgi:hypothetical protein